MKKILFSSIIVFLILCSCKTEAFLMQKYTRYVHSLKCPAKEKKNEQTAQGPSFLNCTNCETLQCQDSAAIILTADQGGSFASQPVSNHIVDYSQPKFNDSKQSNTVGKTAKGIGSFGKELVKRFDYPLTSSGQATQRDSRIGQERHTGIFGFLNTIFKIVLFIVILAVICAVIVLVILLP